MTRRTAKGPTGFDAIDEITRRLGDMAGAVEEALAKGGDHVRDITIDTPAGPLTARVGATIRNLSTGGAGSAKAARRPPKDRDEVPAAEPAKGTDVAPEVFEEADGLVVVFDSPGASADAVRVITGDGWLKVAVGDTPARTVRHPGFKADASAAVRVANGFVEIRLSPAS